MVSTANTRYNELAESPIRAAWQQRCQTYWVFTGLHGKQRLSPYARKHQERGGAM